MLFSNIEMYANSIDIIFIFHSVKSIYYLQANDKIEL